MNFNTIKSRNELANLLGIQRKSLSYVLFVKKIENCYDSFEIPKKNGDKRHINAPNAELKMIQSKLADELWKHETSFWGGNNEEEKKKYQLEKLKLSHAFEKNKNIITNAWIHRNKKFVLNIDLENFFDSFHFGRVRGYFIKNQKYELRNEVATTIAQLTCYNGCLPQGAPTSPIITNLICQIFDIRILGIARKYKLDYTRYADDLTFSTNRREYMDIHEEFINELNNEIEHAGFKINKKKTRVQFKNSKQKVTGLVVNQKINIDQNYYRDTKAMAHRLYTTESFSINGVAGTMNQLEGRFSFINLIDRYNNHVDKQLSSSKCSKKINNELNRFSDRINIEKHDHTNLNGRERQYQKFLFYKYFYGSEKPLVVTEGKTDIVYLKSALKSLYLKYPKLITKEDNGEFNFHISFFRRSKRLEYLFGFGMDGADAMQKIYDLFKGNHNAINYLSYFERITSNREPSKAFLVFDNELNDSQKPIGKFIKHCKVDEDNINALKSDFSLNLIGNLYLVTNPLVDGKNECEIEDLFEASVLNTEINGKIFSREKDCGKENCYGKEIFSKHIADNYKIINFEQFIPMLDAINNLV